MPVIFHQDRSSWSCLCHIEIPDIYNLARSLEIKSEVTKNVLFQVTFMSDSKFVPYSNSEFNHVEISIQGLTHAKVLKQ